LEDEKMNLEDNLAYALSRKFFDDTWGDEKIKLHSECVITACFGMAQNTDLNPDVFMIAGWIHDIGRKINKDEHHKLSVDFLKTFLNTHPEFNNLKNEVTDCILNHRKDGVPQTVYGLIFKAADKVSLHNKRWLNREKK
jgi:HD superfamily phosphodiesterase